MLILLLKVREILALIPLSICLRSIYQNNDEGFNSVAVQPNHYANNPAKACNLTFI